MTFPTSQRNPNHDEHISPHPSSLTVPLRILFGLNGATLSLPSTALLYIVNTRAQVPLVYLSVYGALAFLPNSLKPLYAWCSDMIISALQCRRDQVLTGLLLFGAISLFGTAAIPKNGVASCFVWAFVREVFNAWPEFLLGLTLLDQASGNEENFETNAALCQSQAATARNLGSMIAHGIGFSFFLQRHLFQPDQEQLSEFAVVFLLVVTGLLYVVGAGIAWYHKVGREMGDGSQYARLNSSPATDTTPEVDEILEDEETPFPPPKSSCSIECGDAMLIVLLQTLVVCFAMRGPLVTATSVMTWNIILFALTSAMILTVGFNLKHWTRPHRVGLFLIVRHAIPSGDYMMISFVYSLFQSTPLVMQVFALFGMAVTTISSWSYGWLLAPFSAGNGILTLLVGTTVLGALCSLLNNFVLDLNSDDGIWRILATVLGVSLFTDFSGEWKFLPSVVLATTAVTIQVDKERISGNSVIIQSGGDNAETKEAIPAVSYQHMSVKTCCLQGKNASIGMQYSTLISCLDFGDQIGSWLTMPLVAALGVSRDNEWENMDTFIWVTALLSLVPLALLPIIRN